MFFKVKSICFILIIKIVCCSIVIDEQSQKYINIEDYCPKKGPCEEGTHTLCMYYDPNRRWGPACADHIDVKITNDLAKHILDVINDIRHKTAVGIDYGRPRGFGMFRLNWDNELATFAQIMADRCHLKRDLCRATEQFPDPYQLASIVRHFLGWIEFPGGKEQLSDKPEGLTPDKIKKAIDKSINAWYSRRTAVTEQMIRNSPNVANSIPDGYRFLNLVNANNTHIGCGISAYTQYAFSPANQHVQYQIIQFVCNLSGSLAENQTVYNITKPDPTASSRFCGCPKGSYEDEDCLCVLKKQIICPDLPACRPRKKTTTNQTKIRTTLTRHACSDQSKCFDVSLLPIVNMSFDPETLYGGRRSHFVHNRIFEEPRIYPRKLSQRKDYHTYQAPRNSQFTRGEDKNLYSYADKYSITKPNLHHFSLTRSENIVFPKKDFTDGKNLVKNYLKRRKYDENHNIHENSSPNKSNTDLTSHNKENYIFVSNDSKAQSFNGEVNEKLINILNSLEEDVKYFETYRNTFGESYKNIYSNRMTSNNVDLFERHLIDNIQYAKSLLHEMSLNGVYRKSDVNHEPVEAIRYVERMNPEKRPEKRQQTALQYEYQDIKSRRPSETFENGNENIKFVQRRKGIRHFGNMEDDRSYSVDRRAHYQSLMENAQSKMLRFHGLKHDDNMPTIVLRATRPNGRSRSRHAYREEERARALHGL